MTLQNGIVSGLRRGLIGALLLISGLTLAAENTSNAAFWLKDGKATPLAVSAAQILAHAGDDGLDPTDYDAAGLGQRVTAAANKALPANQQAALAQTLDSAMTHYLHDLHDGRVTPTSINAHFSQPPKPLDAAVTLAAALKTGDLAQAVQAATPLFPLYRELRPWLARYRALVGNPAWAKSLPPLPAEKVSAGASYTGLAQLTARLQALGDLPSNTAVPAHYQGPLVDGVKAFQQRHGLTPDGVLGKTTVAQLNISPAERVAQIELTLERLRWTPLLPGPRSVVVNLPEFVLRGLEIDNSDGRKVRVPLTMNVIVGKAQGTPIKQTPIFNDEMEYIEFSPYWNVPPSIAKGELLPRLARDPGYFNRQGFEFVTRSGEVVTQLSAAQMAAVQRGEARIRQRPGPQNALGDIKFIFPNDDNIYIHHTPSAGLFGRDRRDFSHGCIRAENPLALAEFVLKDEPEWTTAKIKEAMDSGTSRTIRLQTPMPVVIAYATAIIKQPGGAIYFYDDIYGHDRRLQAALNQRNRQPPKE